MYVVLFDLLCVSFFFPPTDCFLYHFHHHLLLWLLSSNVRSIDIDGKQRHVDPHGISDHSLCDRQSAGRRGPFLTNWIRIHPVDPLTNHGRLVVSSSPWTNQWSFRSSCYDLTGITIWSYIDQAGQPESVWCFKLTWFTSWSRRQQWTNPFCDMTSTLSRSTIPYIWMDQSNRLCPSLQPFLHQYYPYILSAWTHFARLLFWIRNKTPFSLLVLLSHLIAYFKLA